MKNKPKLKPWPITFQSYNIYTGHVHGQIFTRQCCRHGSVFVELFVRGQTLVNISIKNVSGLYIITPN